MATVCTNCGTAAVADDARHCHICGAPLPPQGSTTTGEIITPAEPGATPMLSADSRNWAMAAHLLAIPSAAVALAFLGPLVVWLVKRSEDGFVEYHAREAVNFNLSVLVYFVIGVVLSFVLIGLPLLLVLGVLWIVATVMAAVRASKGEYYRYPLTIRFVS